MSSYWSWSELWAIIVEGLTGRRKVTPTLSVSPSASVLASKQEVLEHNRNNYVAEPRSYESEPRPAAQPNVASKSSPTPNPSALSPEGHSVITVREDVAEVLRYFQQRGEPIRLATATAIADAKKRAMERTKVFVPFIQQHVKVLADKEQQLTYQGDYGEWRFEKWEREVGRFIEGVLLPRVGKHVQRRSDEWHALEQRIDDAVYAHQRSTSEAEDARLAEEIAQLAAEESGLANEMSARRVRRTEVSANGVAEPPKPRTRRKPKAKPPEPN